MDLATSVNPLLIDLILQKIFEGLKSSHLKQCRLVCQQWAATGYPILTSKSKTTILFGDSNEHHNLQAFSTALQIGAKLPFKSFILQPCVFSNQRSQTIQEFFVTTANLFQSLFLNYQDRSHHFTLSNKTDFLSDKSLRFSNLCHFRFEVLPYDQFITFSSSSSITLNRVDLFRSVWNAAKNLVRLELVIPNSPSINVDSYLQVICDSSDSKFHKKFSELVLNISLNDERICILQNAKFQFKMIRISQQGSECRFMSPLDFIKNHNLSLQHLKISCCSNFNNFISLPNLRTLEILDYLQAQQNNSQILDFAQTFPSLRKLVFTSFKWHASFLTFFFSQKGFKTMCELKLPKQIELEDNSILVPLISASFPNLVKLEIFLSHQTVSSLSKIFTSLSYLEELSVTFINWKVSKCIDYIITGMPEWICEEIYALLDVMIVDVGGVRINPSILDLKNLQKLQLRNMTKYSAKRPQITDISIHYALMRHPRLSQLYIWPSEISCESIHHLRERLDLNLLSF